MYPTTALSTAIVLAISIIIRSSEISRFYAFGVDTFGNLLYSRGLGGGSLNLYKVGPSALVVYPRFLPWLLNHLRSFSIRTLHIIPKLFDILTSITVFSFTLWLSQNEFIALLALLIYTFSPINVINGYGIGTRNIGSFFFALAILASYVAMFDPRLKYVMFAMAIASSLLMISTSRIAYKSYFILALVTAILLPLNSSFGTFLLVSLISLVLCLAVTRGKFIDDLKAHIFLINFFRKRRGKKKSIVKRIAIVFYYDLWWVIGILAIMNGADLFLAVWLFTVVALSFLWPWGEGGRHIALAAAPASIFSALYLAQRPLLIVPLLLLEISIIIRLSTKVLKGRAPESVDRSLLNLFNAMRNIGDDPLFLCLPPWYNFAVAYFAEKKVLYGDGSSQEGVLFQAEVLDALKAQDGAEELASKYLVTHIFVDRSNFPLEISYNRWDPIIQEERFTVFRRKSAHEK